ncbi:MAG: diguanylate cyclase [Candidatus Aminicenantes bacterium]|nr:MAG: diguanylate cyclase [Candidatus Aminicenantes bacterium]
MAETNILILNNNPEESAILKKLSNSQGSVYCALDLENAIILLESLNFHVLVADHSLAKYSSLRGLFKETTSIIITGNEERNIKEIARSWPLNYYVDFHISPLNNEDNHAFLRTLETASEHSHLKYEVKNLQQSIRHNEIQLKEACSEIKDIKNFISDRVVREFEKRIAVEAKYIWFKNEKLKIEEILKKLYISNDVTSLLDIVFDIKEIAQAQGISFYILDENETLGKYLKPLVWDGAILSHPDFSKHFVLLDSQDFAAVVTQTGKEINLVDFSFDKRLSKRYLEQLKFPLRSILCVPIMHDKEVIGVLEVYNKIRKDKSRGIGFTSEDQRIMSKLSEHISIAITKLNLIQYDALTGILRPDPFFEELIQKLNLERKRHLEASSYAMVMGDVDWFKNFNDRNGHQAGNKLLRELASVLKFSIREEDFLCRYGGEEFLFFLTGINSLEEGCGLTERIRKNVEDHYFEHQEFQPNNNLTMSFGVTLFTRERINSMKAISKNDLKKLANEADMALAEAKGKKTSASKSQDNKDRKKAKNKVCAYYIDQPDKPIKNNMIEQYMEKFTHERRKHQRFYTSTILIYKKKDFQKVTKTINLSIGGAKISTDSKLYADQDLDLILILGNKACQMKGDIVYSEMVKDDYSRYYSGLKFKNISLNDRKILEDYFSALSINEHSLQH